MVAHKTYSQYGALIFFCYLKNTKKEKIYTDSCCVVTEHVEGNSSPSGVPVRPRSSATLVYTPLASIYYLIRMDKMLNALVSISSIYCVGFTNNFLQSFAVLYITVCINCEGPELRCKELL